MKSTWNLKSFGFELLALILIASVLLVGCTTDRVPPIPKEDIGTVDKPAESKLRIGDQVTVKFDTMGGVTPPPMLNTVVDEKGEISLTLVGRIKAEGKTHSLLAGEIEALYVPRYYVHCNVTVTTGERFFFVDGEVKSTGKFAWSEDITLLKAISIAGSFTEYADRSKVELTRGKEKMIFDANEARRDPSKDPRIKPGDSIRVQRGIW